MANVAISSENSDVEFEEDITTHEVIRQIEVYAEGLEQSVFIRLDADEAYELGKKLVHYAFTHGVQP